MTLPPLPDRGLPADEILSVLSDLRDAVRKGEPVDLDLLADALERTIKTGNPYEVPTWKKPDGIGGRR